MWRLVRGLALLTSRRLLVFASMVTTVTLLLTWLGGLWLGFGLVYLPQVSHFATSVHSLHPNLFAALYASATTITTLGLGDTLATQTGIRIAFALEAAAGVASISAIVSYSAPCLRWRPPTAPTPRAL